MTLKEYLTPPVLTPEQIAADEKAAALAVVANEIANGAKAMLDTQAARHLMEFNRVWNHPLLTPQEVVAQLGTMAGALFYGNSGTVEYLVAQYELAGYAGDYTPPQVPAWATIVPNPDGSISITGSPE